MQSTIRRVLASTALLGATLSPQAFATTLDFEPVDLTGLYFPGDSFAQNGFVLSVYRDFGTIDTAAGLGALAPSGNATQFFFNSNDGLLSLAREGGGAFSLSGFSAAFVPLDPASAQTTVIVALGTDTNNVQFTAFWNFATSTTSSFPFTAYSGASDFAAFGNVKQVDFYACSIVAGVICTEQTLNNGQFAIDNILVTAVPEPVTALLFAAGLLGLVGRARRAVR